MRRGLDFDKAEAALRRAAEKATHGTREERAGRFRMEDQRYTVVIHKSGIGVMADKKHELYVERRPEGDYAVRRGGSERASAIAPTQKDAIEKAEKLDPTAAVHVERVRDTKVGGTDRWRKP